VVLNLEKKCRLIISVQLLQRCVAVEIERDWIRPILNTAGPRAVPLTARTSS
jgi:hypothetical protein